MKITIERYNLIRNRLLEIITKKGTNWKEIVSSIDKITKVKNWLVVRGVLQDLRNENLVDRTNNVWEEIYISTKQEKIRCLTKVKEEPSLRVIQKSTIMA